MTAIVTAVLKATVGLLVTKGRDALAKKLQEGDATDEQFRNMIVRELDDIKSKLDGLARKDLLTSISFFKEGIVFLSKALDKNYRAELRPETSKAKTRNETAEAEKDKSTQRLDLPTADVKPISLLKGQETLPFAELDESGKRALADAKKRFDDARMKATEAFNNVALSTTDRILAMQYRVMSTILEKIDSPEEAIATCKLCLEELHSMPAVMKSFEVEVSGGFWSMFKKDERREITNSVRDVNRVVFRVSRVMEAVKGDVILSEKELDIDSWPSIGTKKIKPIEKMGNFEEERTWSFSFRNEGEGEIKLNCPQCITTNTQGDFIVAEREYLKVFNQNGEFLKSFKPVPEFETGPIVDVASDHLDNVYVLFKSEVQVICTQTFKHRTFYLQRRNELDFLSLTVNNEQNIFVLSRFRHTIGPMVQIYDDKGCLKDCNFRYGFTTEWQCVVAVDDGVILWRNVGTTVYPFYLFDAQFLKLRDTFSLSWDYIDVMAFHFQTKHLIAAYCSSVFLQIIVNDKNGHLKRSIAIKRNNIASITGMAVTPEGRIALLCRMKDTKDHEGQQYVVHVV